MKIARLYKKRCDNFSFVFSYYLQFVHYIQFLKIYPNTLNEKNIFVQKFLSNYNAFMNSLSPYKTFADGLSNEYSIIPARTCEIDWNLKRKILSKPFRITQQEDRKKRCWKTLKSWKNTNRNSILYNICWKRKKRTIIMLHFLQNSWRLYFYNPLIDVPFTKLYSNRHFSHSFVYIIRIIDKLWRWQQKKVYYFHS